MTNKTLFFVSFVGENKKVKASFPESIMTLFKDRF